MDCQEKSANIFLSLVQYLVRLAANFGCRQAAAPDIRGIRGRGGSRKCSLSSTPNPDMNEYKLNNVCKNQF